MLIIVEIYFNSRRKAVTEGLDIESKMQRGNKDW
jgi:hypothetical protein